MGVSPIDQTILDLQVQFHVVDIDLRLAGGEERIKSIIGVYAFAVGHSS